MINNYVWMFFVILRCFPVSPRPTHSLYDSPKESTLQPRYSAQNVPKYEESLSPSNDQVISVRITSSVAVGRRKGKPPSRNFDTQFSTDDSLIPSFTEINPPKSTLFNDNYNKGLTDFPPNLMGANIEFIKQLNAKKDSQNYAPNQPSVYRTEVKKEIYEYKAETKPVYEIDNSKELSIESSDIASLPKYHSLHEDEETFNKNSNYTDSIAEPSLKSVQTYGFDEKNDEEYIPLARSMPSSYHHDQYLKKEILLQDSAIGSNKKNETGFIQKSVTTIPISNITIKEDIDHNIPLGRSISISPSPTNNFSGFNKKPVSESDTSESLTTVSFNVVHTPKQVNNFNQGTNANVNVNSDNSKFYEPPKIYSQPAQIYSEPAKFYSEPAKIYSEPAKIYSEPAKIYSEPAKIYSEPAKFYSPPASLHLPPVPADYPWQHHSQSPDVTSTSNTTPITTETRTIPKKSHEHQPEKNYEVDEKASVLSEGRIHGVQESTTEKCKQDNCKVGYVVEGRQYKKYRVEERTSDGFIVGEYGVVRNEDGALRGVRYTADSDASPRLIYDALMKFLQLK